MILRIESLMTIMLCVCLNNIHAQIIKSYMQMEVLAPSSSGPITGCGQDVGLWIEWDNDERKMEMLDGTIWKYSSTDIKGENHYKFVKSNLSVMPGTTYHEAVVSPDKTKIVIAYTFGMMGLYTKMYATYGYIGEGRQPAIDYITKNNDKGYDYGNHSDRYRTFVKTHNSCSKCDCSGYWGYKHGNGTYEGNCSNSDGHGHTCGHGPEKHGLRKW